MAEDYSRSRSYSYSDDRITKQMEMIYSNGGYYYGPRPNNNSISSYTPSNQDLKSYSASYLPHPPPPPPPQPLPGQLGGFKLKKGKSRNGSTSTSSKSWSFNDAEFQRKKRVATYKVYSVEGKVKGSFRKSFRWLKDKYTQVVYGWW